MAHRNSSWHEAAVVSDKYDQEETLNETRSKLNLAVGEVSIRENKLYFNYVYHINLNVNWVNIIKEY